MIQFQRRSSDLLISKYSSNMLDWATQQEITIDSTLIDRQGTISLLRQIQNPWKKLYVILVY